METSSARNHHLSMATNIIAAKARMAEYMEIYLGTDACLTSIAAQESEESSALDDIPAKVDNIVGKITEEASKPTGEDESHKQEGTAADFNKGQISERDVAISTSESIQEETSKSSEDNVKDAEKLNEEENPAEIIKEGNINHLSLENIQEDATETLKHPEREAEKSKEEVG